MKKTHKIHYLLNKIYEILQESFHTDFTAVLDVRDLFQNYIFTSIFSREFSRKKTKNWTFFSPESRRQVLLLSIKEFIFILVKYLNNYLIPKGIWN